MKTKFFIISLLLLLYSLSGIYAQLYLGVKFGANWSTVTNCNSDKKLDLNRTKIFGIVSTFKIHDKLSIQSELLYSVKGHKQTDKVKDYTQRFNNTYLELPLLSRYSVGKKNLKYYLIFGPYVAYWLNGYSCGDENYILDTQKHEFNSIYSPDNTTIIKDNRFDIGAVIGTGITYIFGPGNIIVDARYDYSLTNNNKYSGQKPEDWKNNSNRTISITAGYMLTLGK